MTASVTYFLYDVRRFGLADSYRLAYNSVQTKKSTNGNYHAFLLYWRVKFDLPPLNNFGPKNLPQLNEIIARLEADEHVTGTDMAQVLSGYASLHHFTPADVTEMGFSESTSNNRENGLRCLIPVPERKMGAWPWRRAFAK